MFYRLAARYGGFVGKPARRAVSLPKAANLRQHVGGQVGEWRKNRRRDKQLRMTHHAFNSLPDNERFREMAFTFAVIALAARLMQMGGGVGDARFAAFREIFPLPSGQEDKTRELFRSAAAEDVDAEVYIQQICGLFPPTANRRLLKDVVLRLIAVARIDGELDEPKRQFLKRIAQAFGLRSRAVNRHLSVKPAPSNPYALLNVKRNWSDRQIRNAYLHLIRDSHPDRIQARGGSKASVEAATRHMALLNAAYSLICAERGLKGESA